MPAADRTEKVLRDIHVLFSKAEPFEGSKINVVVNKNEVMDLLKELNSCMYDMMEEYELTATSHDKAKREMQKQQDEMVFDAQRKAEDMYAASLMYTDNALNSIQELMEDSLKRVDKIFSETKKSIEGEKNIVRKNQTDLKAQFADLIDTQKYLHLIEDENRRIAKEKESGEFTTLTESTGTAAAAPEIRINEDYFRAQGLNPDGTPLEDVSGSLSDDLDAEYFKWQQEEESKEEPKKKGGISSIFGKK